MHICVRIYIKYIWTKIHIYSCRGREDKKESERKEKWKGGRGRGERKRKKKEKKEKICFKIMIHTSRSWLLLTRFKAFHVCKSIHKLSNRKQSWLNFSIFLNTLNLLLHVTLLSYMIPAWAANGSFWLYKLKIAWVKNPV